MTVQAIPEGYSTITPSLLVQGADEAIKLYEKAFGAKVEHRLDRPDGKVGHAALTIGSSKLFISDVGEQGPCTTASVASFYLYFKDADAQFAQAKKAGLTELFPVQEMFWGDKMGCVKDKFGISWTLATHVRDVTKDDLEKGMKDMCQKAA